MLVKALKSMIRAKNAATSQRDDLPIESLNELKRIHENAPVDFHMRLLFEHTKIADQSFLPLFQHCLTESQTHLSPWKVFMRAQSALNLAKYFLHSLKIEGSRIECGVFMGFSALLLSKIAKSTSSSYTGKEFFLVDSFSGFSEPSEQDAISVRDSTNSPIRSSPAFNAGDAKGSYEHVRSLMAPYSDSVLVRGWIPEVFARLPDTEWSFVHVDVDLYQPTLNCLSYFHKRLVPGGIIICDDYGSRLFPGAKRAWDTFFNERNLPYIVLETGQSVYIR